MESTTSAHGPDVVHLGTVEGARHSSVASDDGGETVTEQINHKLDPVLLVATQDDVTKLSVQ